jgi:hypothetical protein
MIERKEILKFSLRLILSFSFKTGVILTRDYVQLSLCNFRLRCDTRKMRHTTLLIDGVNHEWLIF